MKITFVLPNINLRGGVRTVRDYSHWLAEHGHQVTVVYPTRLKPLPFGLSSLEFPWRRVSTLERNRWFQTKATVLPVPTLTPRHLPEADLLVATAWETAAALASAPPSKGRKVYYIQDIEHSRIPGEAEATYRLPFHRITTSDWIRERLEAQGATVGAVVPYGIDLDLYQPGPAIAEPTVGMLCSTDPRKGFEAGLGAIERVRAKYPVLRPVLMGAARKPRNFDEGFETHWNVPPEATPEVYRRCRIWICPSRSEGWGLPPLEAMACGCQIITTALGGSPYFAHHEQTALVVPESHPDALAAALERLLVDRELGERLRENGLAKTRTLSFDSSAAALERALHSAT